MQGIGDFTGQAYLKRERERKDKKQLESGTEGLESP